MNQDEMFVICRSLARKYNDRQEYDDLVSVGVCKMLEMVEEGKTDKKLLYSHAKSAMYEYYNLRRGPVSVPKSSVAYSTRADDDPDGWTAYALQKALYGETVAYEDHMAETDPYEHDYEKKEWMRHIRLTAEKHLDDTQKKIIHLRYWQEKTQEEVATLFNMSKMWVSRQERLALDIICNNL